MNDRLPAASSERAKVFVVAPQQSVIETASFGKVTLRAMNVKRFRELTAKISEGGPEEFGFELLCEMAHGEAGERFTMSAIAGLPAHALGDLRKLVDAAAVLCGHQPHDAKKA
jgi:hypothetical protein